MKQTTFLIAALVLGFSLPVSAKGDYEAGKAKSTACAACHGEQGDSSVSSFPKLGGQQRDYIYHALKDYKAGKRKNPIMAEQVKSLSDADMLDLAMYYSKQKGLYLKY